MAADADATSLEARCLAALVEKSVPASAVEVDRSKLKGGYICETLRLTVKYADEATAEDHPATVILKVGNFSRASAAICMLWLSSHWRSTGIARIVR